MKTKFNFGFFSTERASLMGFAILWIMFFHSTIAMPRLLLILKIFGNIGVDVFLLLSGIGLYYSVSRIRSGISRGWVTAFYKKRILRILPATVICLTPWYIYLYRSTPVKPLMFLFQITSLSYWIDGVNKGWYVALAIVLYAFYPILFSLIGKDRKKNLFMAVSLISIIIALNTVIAIVFPSFFGGKNLALARIPVFIAGCFLARLVAEKKEIVNTGVILTVCVIIPVVFAFLIWKHVALVRLFAVWRYMYGIMAFCITVVLSFILHLIHNTWINRALNFLGKYTLEIYLTHNQILTVLNEQAKTFLHSDLLVNTLAATISVLLAIGIHELLNRLTARRI